MTRMTSKEYEAGALELPKNRRMNFEQSTIEVYLS